MKRRAAQTPRAALLSELCNKASAIYVAAARVLRVVNETGPRKRTVLVGLAGGDESTIEGMIAHGMLVKTKGTSKRGTTWSFGTLRHLPEPTRALMERALDG